MLAIVVVVAMLKLLLSCFVSFVESLELATTMLELYRLFIKILCGLIEIENFTIFNGEQQFIRALVSAPFMKLDTHIFDSIEFDKFFSLGSKRTLTQTTNRMFFLFLL